MSVRVMSAAWAVNLPAGEKLVLLALADCANDEGKCWPGIASLMKKTGKGERSLQQALKALDDGGHITRDQRPGKGCHYSVHPAHSNDPLQRHYVYKTVRPDTGEFYIGARSCYGSPARDPYIGSGRWIKAQIDAGVPLEKALVSEHDTREALADAESRVIAQHKSDPLCRNAKHSSPGQLVRPFCGAEDAGRKMCGAQELPFAPQELPPPPAGNAPKPSKNRKEPSPSKIAHELRDDWQPEDFGTETESRRVVDGWPPGELAVQLEMFRAQHGKKGDKFVDWQKAWSTWVLNTRKFGIGNDNGRTNGMGRHQSGDGLSPTTRAALSVFGPS